MAIYREITTKDDVPLSDLLLDAVAEIDLFNEAERPFRELLAQTVTERTFRVHTGDMTWEELAEGEHARTGRLESTEMAFSVKKYGRSLGFSQEFIEDNTADIVRRQYETLVKGALQKEHEVLFDIVRDGWADGTNLWFEPEDYGSYTFTKSHNHVFADTEALFGDADQHSATAHIREANKEIRHHGKRPTIALMSSDMAAEFVDELAYDAQYLIPEAEGLVSTALPDTTMRVDGVYLMQTAWLTDDEVHVIAADEKPIYFHEARPVQLTQGEFGGPVGDPGQLLGSYGSVRYGAVIADPLAGVKFHMTNVA
ncbi:phage major capsid protein [Natronorubrum bangense]|uniref:Major capsid protein n=2 Tax=Natronorubrum bangense TaxID=61858 RepID=L9WK78_9EURY|nr:hypothetical protein [Natronorubrum bangense]ELY49890.1 hypothetical protein C494_07765 [Natronorubrum bangense JCM 10635]QCC55509.1 hypothetical protein DV706_14140 [Natronorubrum bangense]